MKRYIAINAEFSPEGRILPKEIIWCDGRHYEIDQVSDMRRAASLRSGGAGIRYTVRVCGQSRQLFFEDNRWFIDA